MRGCDGADTWTKSKLQLGDFKMLCKKETTFKPKMYKALEVKAMEGNEVQSRLRKMRKELGL